MLGHIDKTLPMGGGWIMALKSPPTTVEVPALSVWFAMPKAVYEAGEMHISHGHSHLTTDSKYRSVKTLWKVRCGGKVDEDDIARMEKFFRRNREMFDIDPGALGTDEWLDGIELEMKVEVLTPEGSVCLMPHEYNIIQDINPYFEMIDGEHCELKELGGIKAAKKLREMVHYCRSRGITKLEALKMVAGNVKRQNIMYLQFHPAYAEYFGLAQ